MLGQNVERVAGIGGVFDQTVVHALGDDSRLHQISAVLGEQLPAAGLAHLVAGAADSL